MMNEQSGERRFGELIVCKSCGRSTSAGRPSCIYCGRSLGNDASTARGTVFRSAEPWETGFNVVVMPRAQHRGDVKTAAAMMEVDPSVLEELVLSYGPVPFFRVSDEPSACNLADRLGTLGFACEVVADALLNLQEPNVRARKLSIENEGVFVEDFNTGRVVEFAVSDAALLVSGSVRQSRIESFQKRPLFGETKSFGESSVSGDESVLDLYCRGSEKGFRIVPSGFDFSCLGSEKSSLARENWSKLTLMLSQKLPALRTDSEYNRLSHALETVWPASRKSETKGRVNTGFGKREFGRSESVSNAEQFLRYSRLRWHLYEK